MAERNKQCWSTPYLWLIRFIGVIVPRRFRVQFRREWEAELEYREELLARWDRLDWRSQFKLLSRILSERRRLGRDQEEEVRIILEAFRLAGLITNIS